MARPSNRLFNAPRYHEALLRDDGSAHEVDDRAPSASQQMNGVNSKRYMAHQEGVHPQKNPWAMAHRQPPNPNPVKCTRHQDDVKTLRRRNAYPVG